MHRASVRRSAGAIGVFLFLASLTSCGGSSPSSPTPSVSNAEAYLNYLIAVMQQNSVNRVGIDWTAFRSQVLAAAPNAATIADTYPAIRVALGLLNDHHSFYTNASGTGGISNPSFPAGCDIPMADTPEVPADVGYVRIPAFSGSGGADFAASLHDAIKSRDTGAIVSGWIVDLRGNGGGNMWPMLAGVGPVLGSGTVGSFIAPGGVRSPWSYRDGASLLNNSAVVTVAVPYELRRPDPRVAVLTDKRVASSGEAIAVAFRARPGTRVFGTETCGVPTANAGFPLSDGASLGLTTALDEDRTQTAYNAPLPPDEVITNSSTLVQRAITWIRSGS